MHSQEAQRLTDAKGGVKTPRGGRARTQSDKTKQAQADQAQLEQAQLEHQQLQQNVLQQQLHLQMQQQLQMQHVNPSPVPAMMMDLSQMSPSLVKPAAKPLPQHKRRYYGPVTEKLPIYYNLTIDEIEDDLDAMYPEDLEDDDEPVLCFTANCCFCIDPSVPTSTCSALGRVKRASEQDLTFLCGSE
jgi:hypothetical protein